MTSSQSTQLCLKANLAKPALKKHRVFGARGTASTNGSMNISSRTRSMPWANCHLMSFNLTMAGKSHTEIGNLPKNSHLAWQNWQTRSKPQVVQPGFGWRLSWSQNY